MPYPLLFHPILKEKVWGGRFLATLGKPLPKGATVGESWELADLPETVAPGTGGQSVIANGPLRGLTLREAIAAHGAAIMGAAALTEDGGFPLLIKYLDARENLSVQVHPSPAYAASHSGSAGGHVKVKSEAWVILHAEPGAIIYAGLKADVTREAFLEHLQSGTVVDALNAVPVQAGQCHYLPSGTVHALGAGVALAEIQTPSDTTFRLYDWGRPTSGGRDLHIEEALACIDWDQPYEPPRRQRPIEVESLQTTPLLDAPEFAIERIEAIRDAELEVATSGMPEVWMVLRGSVRIEATDVPIVEVNVGRTALIPAVPGGRATEPTQRAGPGTAMLERGTSILRVALPSPLKGKIA